MPLGCKIPEDKDAVATHQLSEEGGMKARVLSQCELEKECLFLGSTQNQI